MMQNGYMPYKDSFDHKGPVLYLLNYFGNMISYYRGIWIIEVISLTITVYCLYRIARLKCGKLSSVIVVLLATTLLFRFFEGGNLTEEYAMPCIALSIFVFLDYLINNKISNMRLLVAGASLGTVLMLRPNMIAVWLVFCFFVLAKLVTEKKYSELMRLGCLFSIGVIAVVGPIILWLGLKHDLIYFWNDYIVFNKLYSSSRSGENLFPKRWSAFIDFASSFVFLASIVSIISCTKEKRTRSINIVYLIYMLVNVALIAMAGITFGHYGMVLVPSVIYPLALFFERIEKIEQKNIKSAFLLVVSIYVFSTIIIPEWDDNVIRDIPVRYMAREEREIDSDWDMNCILHCINQYVDKDETISVYGNYDLVYVLSKRKHATRYSYQFPIGRVMPEILDEYFTQLETELPVAIVVAGNQLDERMGYFLKKNGYSSIWSDDPENSQSTAVFVRK